MDIKYFMSIDPHALFLKRTFFYQIINFTEKL